MAETLPFLFLWWLRDRIRLSVCDWVRASIERRGLLLVSAKCLSNQLTRAFWKPAFRAIDSTTSDATRSCEKQHTRDDEGEAWHDGYWSECNPSDDEHDAEHHHHSPHKRIAPTGRAFEEIR
jgi:hypothetical protein